MRLHVGRQRRPQATLRIAQHAMGRAPAGGRRDAAAVFQRGEESMAQERLGGRQQGVPLGGVDIGKGGKRLDRHARQSGARRQASEAGRRKKMPADPAMKPPFTRRRLELSTQGGQPRRHSRSGPLRALDHAQQQQDQQHHQQCTDDPRGTVAPVARVGKTGRPPISSRIRMIRRIVPRLMGVAPVRLMGQGAEDSVPL